jgi:phosphatidylinositol glycan class K
MYLFYEAVRSLGIPDSRIVVMIGEDIPCNPRNPYPGKLYAYSPSTSNPIYPFDSPRTDIHGNEVNRARFLGLLAGRYAPFTPRAQRMGSDDQSDVLVYLSGHSAVGYTKFQDVEDLAAADIADSFEIMRTKGLYKRVFWLSDTCRAASLHNAFYSDEIACLGSSGDSEADKSYSHHRVPLIGQALLDKFTTMTFDGVKRFGGWKSVSLRQLFSHYDPVRLGAVPNLRMDLVSDPDINLIDFFGATDSIRKIPRKHIAVPQGPFSTHDTTLMNLSVFTRHDDAGRTESPPNPVAARWNHWISVVAAGLIVAYLIIA